MTSSGVSARDADGKLASALQGWSLIAQVLRQHDRFQTCWTGFNSSERCFYVLPKTNFYVLKGGV